MWLRMTQVPSSPLQIAKMECACHDGQYKTDDSPEWSRFRSVWDDWALCYELMLIAINENFMRKRSPPNVSMIPGQMNLQNGKNSKKEMFITTQCRIPLQTVEGED